MLEHLHFGSANDHCQGLTHGGASITCSALGIAQLKVRIAAMIRVTRTSRREMIDVVVVMVVAAILGQVVASALDGSPSGPVLALAAAMVFLERLQTINTRQ